MYFKFPKITGSQKIEDKGNTRDNLTTTPDVIVKVRCIVVHSADFDIQSEIKAVTAGEDAQ